MAHLLLRSLLLLLAAATAAAAPRREAFRRDPGHPHWHHGAFHDVEDSVRADVRRMLHTRAEVPFQVPREVNVVLVGFNGDGGHRYSLDGHKLQEFLKTSFSHHRPSCLEAGQPELIALEKALRDTMVPAGTSRESEYGRAFPLFEVEATAVEQMFERLYSFIFDMEIGYSATKMDRNMPAAIFFVNFDKVRKDPRNMVNLDSLMYGDIAGLIEEDLQRQEGDYFYRYRYNGGGATQIWLSSGRLVVVDLSAGPYTYGKIETEEGSVSYRTLPRLSHLIFPRGTAAPSVTSTQDIFIGQLGALILTTIEHVIAPDVRFETIDMTTRLLIPIIVLQNHNRYNILQAGHNYSIDVQAIEREVKKMVHTGQEVIIIGGSHALHQHEKLAVAVSKAMRSHSVHQTNSVGRFHVRTKTYLDGAILKEEMEHCTDVLSAGLLEVADPSLSSKFFLKQRTTIYARVDAALHKIRDTSESVQSFALEHLKTPLGELVKGVKNKSSAELWVEKFSKKITTIPEPFPHDLVEQLEQYLDRLEEQLVNLSSLLYHHRLKDAHQNSSDILQSTIFTQQYVEHILSAERDKMRCCRIEYSQPTQSSQALVYGGILLARFLVYSLVIFFSSPVR